MTTDGRRSPLIAERPVGAPPKPYRFPEVHRLRVAGGEIVAAHLPGRPMAWADVVLESGALHEPRGLDGLARLTCAMLDEGSLDRDADAFGVAVEGLGARWNIACGWETQEIGVDLPADRLADGVALLAEALRRPAFTDGDVGRFLPDMVSSMKAAWAQPGTRAGLAFRRELYGADSRLGGLVGGTPQTLAAIGADDIRAYHRRRMSAPGTLLIAADLDGVDLEALGRLVFAGADGDASRPDPAVYGPPPHGPRTVVVDRPGAVQSVLRLGHRGPDRAAPGLVALELCCEVLGGGFTSRLNSRLREVKGYTYGARAGFGHGRGTGSFTVSTSVHTEVTAAAVVDAVAEVRRMAADGVTAAELEAARAHLLGSMPIRLQTPRGIGARLAEIVVHDLPDDQVTREYARFAETTLDEVDAAAATRLRPDGLTIVVEGDAARVVPDLTAAGFDVVTADV